MRVLFIFIMVSFLIFMSGPILKAAAEFEASQFKTMKWRCVGPYRGGRVTCVAGIPGEPLVYYFGATGGGVWKTEDAGLTWKNVSDAYFKTGSVGAIAVAPSDPNVVYVGMGESAIRGDMSHGDGVYKSVDAGKTWKNVGLHNSRHTRRIRIHPQNPDLVYITVLGHVYGPSKDTGIYRSKDGGETWEKVLYVDENTGAIDLAMDMTNPRILYAAMWQVRMTPWGIFTGGNGSGVYKTTDGGDTWIELKNGLPEGPKGRIGVAVSPVKPDRVWTLIEAEEGGLFRSEDGGKNWKLICDDSSIRDRHYYYTHIYADTQDENTVYVMTSPFLKSIDGGRSFSRISVPHGDNQDLWIAPENNQRMINANDGGANVSFNGGESWTGQDNQPTAQIYHVITDNQFPYRVYGAQQDNSTICVPSRGPLFMRGMVDMYAVAGGESGYIAVNPENSNITYGGSYWGRMSRYDLSTKERTDISPWPELPAGQYPAQVKYRFNWTFPIILSPFDPKTVYAAANVLFKSTDEGHTWEVISPDLTRDDESKQQDAILTQVYCTIFTVVESPLQKDLIWVGSDDGLVHITTNGGENWQNVTPKQMPEWSRVNIIEASPHDAATAYLAVNRYDLDDLKPYIYKTNDYGQSWKLITKGIAEDAFVRVVREDPKKKGLLYAGTETGVYVSFDDGQSWQSLQLNLPVVPVHDMVVKEDDLVAATHGRSFWILDDLTPLQQLTDEVLSSAFYLFEPRDAFRAQGFNVVINYYLKEKPEEEVTLEFMDSEGNVIKALKGAKEEKEPAAPEMAYFRGRLAPKNVPARAGLNRFEWDMRYPDTRGIKGGTHLHGGNLRGPVAVPGTYQVKLTVGGESVTKSLEIKMDPRISVVQENLQEKFDFLMKIRDRMSETHNAINQIFKLESELKMIKKKVKGLESEKSISAEADNIKEKLVAVKNELFAPRVRASLDFNFVLFTPLTWRDSLKLNNRLANVKSVVEGAETKPADQCYENFKELSAKLDVQLAKFKEILEKDIPAFNSLISELGVPAVPVK
jgi:photosystem II stability/assembly factor-like uncharacterized protein